MKPEKAEFSLFLVLFAYFIIQGKYTRAGSVRQGTATQDPMEQKAMFKNFLRSRKAEIGGFLL